MRLGMLGDLALSHAIPQKMVGWWHDKEPKTLGAVMLPAENGHSFVSA